MSSTKTIRNLGLLLLGIASVAVCVAQVQEDKSRAGTVTRPKQKEQETNQRTLEGMVATAGDNPAEGAIVQLKDTRTLQIRSFRTQADGKFRFAGLSLDTDYEIRATRGELSSDTKRISSFDSRKSVTVNLLIEAKK